MRDVEERAEAVLAALPSYVWDRERLPGPVEDIADTQFGLLVTDVEDMYAAPGAPELTAGQSLVNAGEARRWPPRRRFTIGHELGHRVMHRTASQQALFCRRTSVSEQPATRPRDIEEEASVFAAALLMPQWLFVREHARTNGRVAALCETFGSAIAATERRIASLF